jgi:hypothetical protein
VLVNVLAGMGFVQIFAPNLLQLQRSIDKIDVDGPPITMGLVQQAGEELLIGMPRSEAIAAAGPLLFWATVLTLLALIAAAACHVVRRFPQLALILAAVIGAVLVYLLTAALLGQYFYDRFIIHALVPVVALIGIGIEVVLGFGWVRGSAGSPIRKVGASLAVAIVLALFVACTWSRTWLYQTRPYAPMRDVAEFLQDKMAPGSMSVLGYGLGGDIMRNYEPRVQFVRSREEVERACRRADEEKQGLYLFYGYETFNRAAVPDGFSLIDDLDTFEEIAHFEGIEPDFYFRVMRYRMKPGA